MEIEHPYFEVLGAQAERKLRLEGTNSWTIGRSPENLFVLEDDAMSRRHALVQQMQRSMGGNLQVGVLDMSRLGGFDGVHTSAASGSRPRE